MALFLKLLKKWKKNYEKKLNYSNVASKSGQKIPVVVNSLKKFTLKVTFKKYKIKKSAYPKFYQKKKRKI